jgi:ABC-type branched-subunit amino acid transport system substrate-binding protein
MQKKSFLYLLVLLAGVSACTPKVGTLRSPNYQGNVGAGKETKVEEEDNKNKVEEVEAFTGATIALVLPFQLDQIAATSVVENDIKRSALALDFYQGFQMGLEEVSKSDKDFYLNVLDSQDDNFQNITLAKSDEVEQAAIVIGPVYPKEIKTLGENLVDQNILQINPLAASMPSEFNLPNLVSLRPSIKSHSNAIAAEVGRQFSPGDVVIIYNTSDADGRQFLKGMSEAIKHAKTNIRVLSVSSVGQLNENVSSTGYTHVVAGTTDKLQIRALINNLTSKAEEGVNFRLYGHPLWDRYDWSIYADFAAFSPKITSESTLKNWTSAVKKFNESYNQKYGVQPSDHSYRGYDCAKYFAKLLKKYDRHLIKEHLVGETYEGMFSNYTFKHNDVWGFSNEAVVIRQYRGGDFQLQ